VIHDSDNSNASAVARGAGHSGHCRATFNTAPSILLVIAGIALALTLGLPQIALAPDLVLFGILPPLSR
jgi:hypothetical protein